jgi:hypothetical protein
MTTEVSTRPADAQTAPAKIVTDTPGCHCPHCCVSDEVMEARMAAIYSKSPSERLATQVPFDTIKDAIGEVIVFLDALEDDRAFGAVRAELFALMDAQVLLAQLLGNERPLIEHAILPYCASVRGDH